MQIYTATSLKHPNYKILFTDKRYSLWLYKKGIHLEFQSDVEVSASVVKLVHLNEGQHLVWGWVKK